MADATTTRSAHATVQLVANSVYAQVRHLLKYPKRGRRACTIRADICTSDADFFKGRTLSDVIHLASSTVCPEWWIRYVNEHGDANELLDFNASVKIRKHRRDTYWVKMADGSYIREESCRGLYLFVKLYRQRR